MNVFIHTFIQIEATLSDDMTKENIIHKIDNFINL